VGRARPRTAQNPAARLGEDEMDMAVSDDDEDAADVAGPSGLHGEAHHSPPNHAFKWSSDKRQM
jgi:hypothetical protein